MFYNHLNFPFLIKIRITFTPGLDPDQMRYLGYGGGAFPPESKIRWRRVRWKAEKRGNGEKKMGKFTKMWLVSKLKHFLFPLPDIWIQDPIFSNSRLISFKMFDVYDAELFVFNMLYIFHEKLWILKPTVCSPWNLN